MTKFLLFPYLKYKCNKDSLLSNSSYRKYYDKNIHIISDYPELRKYEKLNDSFSLIKMNIILKGFYNKKKIENEVELYKDANLKVSSVQEMIHMRLPYMKLNSNDRIYVPFFTPIYNKPYDRNLYNLLKPPYQSLKKDFISSIVSPFLTYGYDIFDSYFTNLILIRKSDDLLQAAFYSVELETIFIISDQGNLEEEIPLFDTNNIDFKKEGLFRRLDKLVEDYFNYDKIGFIHDLFSLHFISKDCYDYILLKEGIN